MKNSPNALVYVSGGNVQGARSNVHMGIEIFDVDNLEAEGFTKDQIEEMWIQRSQAFPLTIY